jgi:hypothetical protein
MGGWRRRATFAGIEARVCSQARRALDVSPSFGDAALGYFTARLDPAVTRRATVTAGHQAKRYKAFDDGRFLGLALDGTSAGRSRQKVGKLCRPYRNKQRQILGRPLEEQSPRIIRGRPEKVGSPASPASLPAGEGPGGNLRRRRL